MNRFCGVESLGSAAASRLQFALKDRSNVVRLLLHKRTRGSLRKKGHPVHLVDFILDALKLVFKKFDRNK